MESPLAASSLELLRYVWGSLAAEFSRLGRDRLPSSLVSRSSSRVGILARSLVSASEYSSVPLCFRVPSVAYLLQGSRPPSNTTQWGAGGTSLNRYDGIALWKLLLTWGRWLFIIEGAATVFFAFITAFVIPDWPATTKWLSLEEKALGVVRMIEDAGDEEEDINVMDAFKMAAKDYRIWLCILGQVSLYTSSNTTK